MDWDQYRAEKNRENQKNYDRAVATYLQAQELARLNGLDLVQYSPWHFALICERPKWVYNLYPSNQRIYADPKHKGPFLKVPEPWTFLDVVSAAIIQPQCSSLGELKSLIRG